MSKNNQLNNLRNFIFSQQKTLIINNLNEEVANLYIGIIEFFALEKNIKVLIDKKDDKITKSVGLFQSEELKIYFSNSAKHFKELLEHNDKRIIFTDYKNFKLNKNLPFLNSYNYEKDIIEFIHNFLNIQNKNLLYYCVDNPHLLFSEISKFLINSNNYISDQKTLGNTNYILDIRKKISQSKKEKNNIKDLYFYFKKEVLYKKFNFLTY